MPDVSYSRVNWKDSPSTDTPINSENLNKMDKGISDCAAEINNRQPKTDNNLNTTSKNTTGAINELVTAIGGVNNDLTAIITASKIGVGTANFTIESSRKRLLCVTKKSGVIVESKEIPTSVLSTNDVIPLGNNASVIGSKIKSGTGQANMIDKPLMISSWSGNNPDWSDHLRTNETTPVSLAAKNTLGLAVDLSSATEASITYNGNNSFTINVTDSSLSVYVY